MGKKILKFFIALAAMPLGYLIYYILKQLSREFFLLWEVFNKFSTGIAVFFVLLSAIIFYILSPYIIKKAQAFANYTQKQILSLPFSELITGVSGFIVAIVIAYFITMPLDKLPYVGLPLTIAIYIFLGYVGLNVGRIKKDEVATYFQSIRPVQKEKLSKKSIFVQSKILDTSVIIDGRIAEILSTGFIDGKIVIPTFVLEELQHIADSSDDVRRARGRRGLDILNKLQNDNELSVEINDTRIDDAEEVDIKLLKLAKRIKGSVVTNDYNLNKVAKIHGVKVLNINDLSNAVKPRMIPGEKMSVLVLKEGKENMQGIAYLDDGTMIVVENGKKHIGKDINVEVTSVLQTSAGRMIFAKPV